MLFIINNILNVKATGLYYYFLLLLSANKINIIKKNKKTIYKTILESICLYGGDLWKINKRNKSKIRPIEMDYWLSLIHI